jgi:VanZ family protein
MMDQRFRTLAFNLAVVLSLIVLFKPGGDGPLPFPQADKVIHATTFALLAITAWWRFKSVRTIAIALVAYAVLSEFIQHFFIPGREFDVIDILADSFGAFAILLIVKLNRHPAREAYEFRRDSGSFRKDSGSSPE